MKRRPPPRPIVPALPEEVVPCEAISIVDTRSRGDGCPWPAKFERDGHHVCWVHKQALRVLQYKKRTTV